MSSSRSIEKCGPVPSQGGLTDDEVRQWSRELGIDVKNKTKAELCNEIKSALKGKKKEKEIESSSKEKVIQDADFKKHKKDYRILA